MESKRCSMCDNEKDIKDFLRKYTDCDDCNCKGGLKRYYQNKDKISDQRRICYEGKKK